jgi:drug/metabolite transporter (DMT)-like permease
MNLALLGEIAALATSAFFTTGSVLFTLASRHVGPLALNRTRLAAAWIFLAMSLWILTGSLFPRQAGWYEWLWLGGSGIIGLALGDLFLFEGYRTIGPRLTMLMMSLSPILTTLLAWIIFSEVLSFEKLIGIGITIGGVVVVVLERRNQDRGRLDEENLGRGLAAGLGAAACQSIGLILARQGLSESFSPLAGNFIRMSSAAAVMWISSILSGQMLWTIQTLRNHPRAFLFSLLGAFVAPFLGVSLSLFAIQATEIGVASTLMALPPVFLMPVSFIVFKERFGLPAVLGTLIALCGIAILFIL